jgi:hypothetical protein
MTISATRITVLLFVSQVACVAQPPLRLLQPHPVTVYQLLQKYRLGRCLSQCSVNQIFLDEDTYYA